MAEEVGGIVYEVGMDVKGLKAGATTANKTLDDLESSLNKTTGELNKLDKGARNAGNGMKNAGGAASGLKTSMSMLAGAISVSLIIGWGKAFLDIADNMTQLQARIKRLTGDAETAKETFNSLTNIASTTGASLSDTTKLWETLTSSLKEAGATNAQVLNLTDTLQKIGRIGGSSTEEMANALRQFGQSIASGTVRAEEFNSILEQMPELARQIAAGLGISMGELRARMLDGKLTAEDALNAIQDRTSVVNAEFEKLPRTMSQATGSLETSFAKLVSSIDSATGASQGMVSAIDGLSHTIDTLASSSSTGAEKLLAVARVMAIFNPTLAEAVANFDKLNAKSPAVTMAEQLANDMKVVTSETKKADEATKHLKIAQAPTKDKKGKGKGKSAEERQAESVAEKLEKLRQQTMLNATSTSELSREQAILNAQQSLGKAATQEQIKLAGEYAAKIWDQKNALKEQAAAEKRRIDAVKGYSALKSQTSPIFAVETSYQKDMADLDAYAKAYPQKMAEIQQTRATIEEQYRQKRLDAMWQEWSQQNAATQSAAAAFDAFDQTAGNALTGILTGSMSVSDALRSIGSNILSSVINAFVQMGIQWAQSVIMGQAGMAAASAATMAQAAAIAAAMAPAAAMTSLATAGTNSAPAMAGMSATVGLAKTLSIAGALKNGGPAQEGSMYRVGENNLPEIFQASNGHQYMIPGDSGRVISNKDLTGGSSGVVVYNNVINNSSAQVSSSARDNGDGSVTIETIVSDIENNGPIGQSISRNYSANRRATE